MILIKSFVTITKHVVLMLPIKDTQLYPYTINSLDSYLNTILMYVNHIRSKITRIILNLLLLLLFKKIKNLIIIIII